MIVHNINSSSTTIVMKPVDRRPLSVFCCVLYDCFGSLCVLSCDSWFVRFFAFCFVHFDFFGSFSIMNDNIKDIKVGQIFSNYEQFFATFKMFCDENCQPLILTNNNKRQVTILCLHGYDRPSNNSK